MAQSTPRKTSITARRTYALLKGALFSQLAALPFEQLTLTDICNTALISRSTFYRYFEDKYDLLHYCLGSMLDELGLNEDVMYFTNRTSVRDFLLILLRLIGENRILYQKIYHANQDGDLMRIIRTGLIRIMNDKIQAAEQKGYRLKLPAPIFTSLMTDFYLILYSAISIRKNHVTRTALSTMSACLLNVTFLHRRSPEPYAQRSGVFYRQTALPAA